MSEAGSQALSRRHVVLGAGACLVAAGAIVGPALQSTWRKAAGGANGAGLAPTGPIATVTVPGPGADVEMKRWSEQVGSIMTVSTGSGTVPLKLYEVKPLNSNGVRPKGVRPMAFAVLFVAQVGSLPRGDSIYPVSHAVFGEMSLYLTGAGDYIAAVFN